MNAQEGTKVICMWFTSGKKLHQETEAKKIVKEFYTTRFNILIPIFISMVVFIFEIDSIYYVDGKCVNWLDIIRLINTTFTPTHIATATGFLYQHFSLNNYYNNRKNMLPSDNLRIKSENVEITMISTIFMAIVYLFCCFKIGWVNQLFLLFMQSVYMIIIFKYCISDKIVSYEELVENVVSY